ncbi:MAG: hypothetical protein J2P50_16845 [Hyphomicrobiaceae bacterium]|nr:hypothetical protein [Hyphomicrobiaceae bacterium]
MRTSPILHPRAFIVVVAFLITLFSAAQAQEDDEGLDHGNEARGSTWEPNTSLTFQRYFEPFPRLRSARACRDRCVTDRRCTGWTYYDPNFREAGDQSYRLQRVCVLGAGVKDRKFGNRPGRTSGVVRIEEPPGEQDNGDYRQRREDYRSPRKD